MTSETPTPDPDRPADRDDVPEPVEHDAERDQVGADPRPAGPDDETREQPAPGGEASRPEPPEPPAANEADHLADDDRAETAPDATREQPAPVADDATREQPAPGTPPTPGPTPPPADPPAPEPAPGLYRSSSDRLLAGVCGGIGQRYDIEPVIVRLGFLATLLLGGAGFLFYVAAAILIPRAPADPAAGVPVGAGGGPAVNAADGALRILFGLAAIVGLFVALCIVAGISFATTIFLGAWPVSIVLAVLGGLLILNARSRRTVGSLLVLVLALALPAAAAVIADISVDRSAGDRLERPATVGQATAGYRLGLGEMTIDLRDLDFRADAPVTIPARVDVGQLNVIVPPKRCVAWTVQTRTRIGDVRVLNGRSETDWITGNDHRTYTIDASDSRTRPHVTLDLRVGLGEIRVARSRAELRRFAQQVTSLSDRTSNGSQAIRTDACRPHARSDSR